MRKDDYELLAAFRRELRRFLAFSERVAQATGLPAQQYQALLGTEEVTVEFAEDGIRALARTAAEVNEAVENIGARRLQTVMEKLLETVSFEAEDRRGERLLVDAGFVDSQLSSIARDTDLSRYVL